jgi:lipoate-protein ligase A
MPLGNSKNCFNHLFNCFSVIISHFPVWRYIPPLEASGVVQMAIDSWLFNEHKQGRQPPILRFYTWSPAAVSLGYHQYDYPSHWHNLSWQGQSLQIIRRPTGGRAVLHQGDLTYVVVTSHKQGKRWEVYQSLCDFLIQGWRSLGIDLSYGKGDRPYINSTNCFSSATGADLITSEGYKLIGSAQKRQGKVLLQHGSMMVNTDPTLYTDVFGEIAPPKIKISFNHIIETLTETAKNCFEIDLSIEPLSDSEWKQILLINKPCIMLNQN